MEKSACSKIRKKSTLISIQMEDGPGIIKIYQSSLGLDKKGKIFDTGHGWGLNQSSQQRSIQNLQLHAHEIAAFAFPRHQVLSAKVQKYLEEGHRTTLPKRQEKEPLNRLLVAQL
mmetsp:Transcript_1595/g.2271  ORF Transcript_1595/g.2271 Transcript_1595/m.2271 type:complete len:115 (-) Transcript_1595:1057-1401(-)